MFRITFTNELGKIEMGGGRHPNMNITSVSGFSNPKKEFKTVSFSGQPGMFTTSERELSRTMILAGNFFGTAAELNKIYTVLSKAGILTVYFHLKKREIP